MNTESFLFIQSEFPWFFPAFVFLFGACVGSFLNVCIYRIPAERSVVTPGSTCRCGKAIAWYDNIPMLSWLILRGKARCCGTAFSVRYPAIELLTALLFLACWFQFPVEKALCAMVFSALLVCAAFIDIDHMIIPDRFSIGGALVGVALSMAVPSLHAEQHSFFAIAAMRSLVDAMLGVCIGSAVILWIGLLAEAVMRKEAMGFGDVKLLGCIGAFAGWQGAIFSIFGGAILGTLAILCWLPFRKKTPTQTGEAQMADGEAAAPETKLIGLPVPFGPMLSAAGLLYLLWLSPWVDSYFSSIAEILSLQ